MGDWPKVPLEVSESRGGREQTPSEVFITDAGMDQRNSLRWGAEGVEQCDAHALIAYTGSPDGPS